MTDRKQETYPIVMSNSLASIKQCHVGLKKRLAGKYDEDIINDCLISSNRIC